MATNIYYIMVEEDIREQKTKRAMFKTMRDGTIIVIAKDNRGVPLILEEKT